MDSQADTKKHTKEAILFPIPPAVLKITNSYPKSLIFIVKLDIPPFSKQNLILQLLQNHISCGPEISTHCNNIYRGLSQSEIYEDFYFNSNFRLNK